MKTCIMAVAVGILLVVSGCGDQNNKITISGSGFETIGEPSLLYKYPAVPGDSYGWHTGFDDSYGITVMSVDSQISVPGGPHCCHSYQSRSGGYHIGAPIFNSHLEPSVGFVRSEFVDTLGDRYFIRIWELEEIDIVSDPPREWPASKVIMPLHPGWHWRGVQTTVTDDDTLSSSLTYIISGALTIYGEKWYLLEPEGGLWKSAQLKGTYTIYTNRIDGLWQWSVRF